MIFTSMPGNGLADGVSAKWFQIIDGDYGACFGAAVTIAYRNSQIVEELQRFGFGEGAAYKQGAQLAAEGLVNLPQKRAADFKIRAAARQGAISGYQRVQDFSLAWRQSSANLWRRPRSRFFRIMGTSAM